MKHDASRASSSTVEKGPGGDEVGVGESDGIAAMPAATKRKANNNLGVGVDMADEADLVLAMQGVLERADEETKAGKFSSFIGSECDVQIIRQTLSRSPKPNVYDRPRYIPPKIKETRTSDFFVRTKPPTAHKLTVTNILLPEFLATAILFS